MQHEIVIMNKNPSSKQKLRECEHLIELYFEQRVKAAEALYKIQHEKLFEADGYENYPEYVKEKWGFSKAYGYQLAAFGSCRILMRSELARQSSVKESAIADNELPASEGQARTLSLFKHEPAIMVQVWEEAKLATDKEQPTQEDIKEAIQTLNLSKPNKVNSWRLTNEMEWLKGLLLDCGQAEEELTKEYLHYLCKEEEKPAGDKPKIQRRDLSSAALEKLQKTSTVKESN